MAAAARTPSARSSRREQILAAAAELFAGRGFHGVSIDDIGAAVGISGPGIYRHFTSKQAMLGEMLVGISEELLSEGRRRTEPLDDADAELHALVDWHVEFALDRPALISVQSRDLASLTDSDRGRVRRLQRSYVEIWVSALCRAVPGLGERPARAAAHALFGMVNSTPHSALLDRRAMTDLLRTMALSTVHDRTSLAATVPSP